MIKAWSHLKTITKHRNLVMIHCFKVGLYRRGLLHDLSKYGWTEFRVGCRYYQGTRSPNAAEREVEGWSTAWMHHKGRNKHHFEYWTDILPGTRVYAPVPMPTEYLVESVMDRIAACKVYRGEAYADGDALAYLDQALDSEMLHPETLKKLRFLLVMLRDRGEKETFRFIREVVLKELPFGEETT
ncbi:MAG: catalase [Clostridia bacterium]|nr:catalase [Clostridia bacterium]